MYSFYWVKSLQSCPSRILTSTAQHILTLDASTLESEWSSFRFFRSCGKTGVLQSLIQRVSVINQNSSSHTARFLIYCTRLFRQVFSNTSLKDIKIDERAGSLTCISIVTTNCKLSCQNLCVTHGHRRPSVEQTHAGNSLCLWEALLQQRGSFHSALCFLACCNNYCEPPLIPPSCQGVSVNCNVLNEAITLP